jgi:hypothetical protein
LGEKLKKSLKISENIAKNLKNEPKRGKNFEKPKKVLKFLVKSLIMCFPNTL